MSQNIFYFNLYEFLAWWIQAFVGKLTVRCFRWFPAAIFLPLTGTPTWHLYIYKALKIWVRHFPNISHMKYCTGLIFGKAFCLFIFFYFPDSELSVLNGLHFYFLRKQRIHYHTCTSTNMSAKLIMGTTKGCPTALGYWIDLSLYTSII